MSPDIERALRYTLALNESDVTPRADELDRFVTTKPPKASSTTSPIAQRIASIAMGDFLSSTWVPGDAVSSYLLKMGWLIQTDSGGLRITASGQAILRHQLSESKDEHGGASVFTSTPDKPMILSHLLTLMANRTSSIYIDPYLDADNIELLLTQTPVRKVLTKENRYIPAIKARLQELGKTSDFEIRVVTNGDELHDRSILHDAGGATLVGTSLTGLQGKYSVAVDLPTSLVGDFYSKMTRLWEASTPLDA
jgi:hypothetical protein